MLKKFIREFFQNKRSLLGGTSVTKNAAESYALPNFKLKHTKHVILISGRFQVIRFIVSRTAMLDSSTTGRISKTVEDKYLMFRVVLLRI